MENRNIFYRLFGILLLIVLAFEAAGKADLRGSALADSWQTYRNQQSNDPPAFRFKYESCFQQAASQYDLPLALLLAVARGESDFNPRAVSKANAIGIMQILWPATAQELGIKRKSDLYDPCTNIDAGARYLRSLMDRYQGDYHLSLAAYNYGPHRIQQSAAPFAIPEGAQWYSAYIFDHLQYVLGEGLGIRKPLSQKPVPIYADFGKYPVIAFNRPFRARSFREYLQGRLPNIRFDWFDKGLGRYQVVMVYSSKKEFRSNIEQLRGLGLNI